MCGAHIYAQSIGMADRLFITRVEHAYDCDTSFPEWDRSQWRLVSGERFERGEK